MPACVDPGMRDPGMHMTQACVKGIGWAEAMLDLARACSDCDCTEALREIVETQVRFLLPHQGALLVVGRRWQNQLRITHVVSVGYPEAALRNALGVESLSERKAFQTWLSNGRPLVLDLPADAGQMSACEAREICEFQLGRIAAHGLLDPAREMGSYMSYAGVEPTWPKTRVTKALQFITAPLHMALMQALTDEEDRDAKQPTLSPTELQLVRWLAQGLTNADMAHLRQRSVNTIRNQLSALFSKLNASNRTEALARAQKMIL